MARFIIMGSWCEYMAHYQAEAKDEAEAIAKWKAAFTPEQVCGMIPVASNLAEHPYMAEYWRGDGDRYWSGSYLYF